MVGQAFFYTTIGNKSLPLPPITLRLKPGEPREIASEIHATAKEFLQWSAMNRW